MDGIKTVVVAVGGGLDSFNVLSNMEKIVQNANGTLTQIIIAFRGNHN